MDHHLVLLADLAGHDDRAWHVAWNPTKPFLASCSADKTVRMHSYSPIPGSTGVKFTHMATISTDHAKTVRSLAWSPSGSSLATASFDANVAVWEQDDSGDWECTGTLEGHETECKSVGFSSSGSFLASCSRDKTVWIWEVLPDDYNCESVLMEHSQDVKCIAWHPTEEILASASYDDTIKLYEDDPDDDWYCFITLSGHTSTVWSLAWSPDGQYLASSSEDRTIRIWKRVGARDWPCVLVLDGHGRSIYSVSWAVGRSGSLGWIASAGGDCSVRIWEISENPDSTLAHRLIAQLDSAHDVHDVNAVVWCPRPEFQDILATAGDDGAAKVWRVVPIAA
ncbi:WD40-repeat-containing domain protein [Mycena floridula]|nr:WD40-repeat-containing domain protein [Mycena floridula]